MVDSDSAAVAPRKHRVEVYIRRPKEFEIPGCACGNKDPEWSEWWGHLWCEKCQIDFVPSNGGVFDGPIPINTAHMLGLCFATINIVTGHITQCCESCTAQYPAQIGAAA